MSNKYDIPDVRQRLDHAADTYDLKGLEYGHTYWKFGHVMQDLFPIGLTITNADDWTRLSIINQIVGKLCRYVNDWEEPNTKELNDIGVYIFILEYIDDCIRHRDNRPIRTGSSAAE